VGQSGEKPRADLRGIDARRERELLEVGGLVVLLPGQRDAHEPLHHARIDGHAGRRRARSEDLERLLVDGGRHLDGERLHHRALAREAIALAHEIVPELHLVHDGGRRNGAGDELHPARRAAAATSAGGGDVDAARVGGLQDAGAGGDAQLTAGSGMARIADDDEGDRHARSF
jgi:hypothetical protein